MTPKLYVIDSNVFMSARDNYYPEIFPSFWEALDEAVRGGVVLSVREVWDEISQYKGEQEHLKTWLKKHEHIFSNPDEIEQEKTREIIKKYPHAEKKAKGAYWADPYVIARAQVYNAAVVTEEGPGKNPLEIHKIPDICKALGVPCIHPRQFMEELKWRF